MVQWDNKSLTVNIYDKITKKRQNRAEHCVKGANIKT